ncbi:hypothetical protein FDF29_11785 [Clostridium botulinum]|uniref:Phage-related protein n=1 Tax=Clostridium botulinum (strain Hall / ATCC 3502 / NCTC 13319 / Type A) TaxID=441771 RepID=A5I2F0_CLOBH|nr:hypothetical protein [Clostridium botulinum]CAL83217.1 putative phage-related protein [Clostridium botulinum A str. ATCC 3502]NFA18610.1 hypothetical protein [Clostridium botulinum]NFA55012.1 hypothetical protein [Clostridium botulinum]NFA67624.1 hypothetical protein [Clostridium botulinum]
MLDITTIFKELLPNVIFFILQNALACAIMYKESEE